MGKTMKISKWMLNSLMFALMAVCLIPLIWVVRTAFIRQDLALDLFAVSVPVLDNFKRVLTAAPFFQYYGNTIFITLGVLAVQFLPVSYTHLTLPTIA